MPRMFPPPHSTLIRTKHSLLSHIPTTEPGYVFAVEDLLDTSLKVLCGLFLKALPHLFVLDSC